jgi:hypothetical protein
MLPHIRKTALVKALGAQQAAKAPVFGAVGFVDLHKIVIHAIYDPNGLVVAQNIREHTAPLGPAVNGQEHSGLHGLVLQTDLIFHIQ